MPKNKGFTLIEMMVVVFIIGLLASIVIVSVNSARIKARDAKRKADIQSLKTAIELYANDNKQYPHAGGDGAGIYVSGLGLVLNETISYLSPMPHDPKCPNGVCPGGAYDYGYVWQTNYGYGLWVHWDDGTFCRTGNEMCREAACANDQPNGWWNAVSCDF